MQLQNSMVNHSMVAQSQFLKPDPNSPEKTISEVVEVVDVQAVSTVVEGSDQTVVVSVVAVGIEEDIETPTSFFKDLWKKTKKNSGHSVRCFFGRYFEKIFVIECLNLYYLYVCCPQIFNSIWTNALANLSPLTW